MEVKKNYIELEKELYETRLMLEEANDTIDAIRSGEIDALVVKSGNGHQLYTLKSADQTYRMFIEKMNEGALTLNDKGLMLYCNSSFAEMVQIPLSKVIGLPFIDLIQSSDRKMFSAAISKASQSKSKGEIALLRKDGTSIPILFSLSTLELDEGKALSIIVTDLTSQKESESKLQQNFHQLQAANNNIEKLNNELENKVSERTKELLLSREHFKFLADNIPVISWTALPDGELTYFNKRWYDYIGLDKDRFEMKDWLDFVHPDDRAHTIATWSEAVECGDIYTIEYRLKGTDGTYRWHYSNGLPYKNEHGETVAWFGISSDIEYQKIELEKKDQFISMVSHELRTPLTSLKGFTQLLMLNSKKDTENPVNGILDTMNNQINKLTRLITDLLDATKSNAGELQFDKELFDFNSLVTEVTNEMQQTTTRHKLDVKLAQSVNIYGDRNRIGQVIINLISNAIKYSPKTSKIHISSYYRNEEVIFCVKDHGIGIHKSHQSNLYTRFYRAVTTDVAHTFPGMGLGLFISKKIIEKHSGSMWVESEPDKGSEFYFSLPLTGE